MFPAIVTSLFGYCAIVLQQLEANMIKHTTEQPVLEVVSRDRMGGGRRGFGSGEGSGGGGVNWKSQQGVCVSSAARCLFPSQSPKQQSSVHNSPGGTLDDNKTSSANATTIPCHSVELLC